MRLEVPRPLQDGEQRLVPRPYQKGTLEWKGAETDRVEAVTPLPRAVHQ